MTTPTIPTSRPLSWRTVLAAAAAFSFAAYLVTGQVLAYLARPTVTCECPPQPAPPAEQTCECPALPPRYMTNI